MNIRNQTIAGEGGELLLGDANKLQNHFVTFTDFGENPLTTFVIISKEDI